jgi:hypothetical protein
MDDHAVAAEAARRTSRRLLAIRERGGAAGLHISRLDRTPLRYNQPDLTYRTW